jgi:YVTN family beta-propeller protein
MVEKRTLVAVIWTASLVGCGTLQGPTATNAPPTPGAIIASVSTGRGPTLLAISPDGAVVYAATVGTLFAIQTSSNAVARTAAIDPYTSGIAVTPDGRNVLAIASASGSLAVIPTGTLAPTSRIALPQDLYPGGYGRIAVGGDGRSAWVVNEYRWLASLDLPGATARRSMLDMRPFDVALGPDGRTLYVAGCKLYCAKGTIEVIDAATQRVTANLTVGPRPYRLAFSPDGQRAYTTNLGDPSLSIVDLTGGTTATLPVGIEPTGLAVSADGARVYVTSNRTGALTVTSGDGRSVLATIQIPGQAHDVVLSPDGRRAYVATSAPNAVVVLDTQALAPGDR